MLTHAGGREFRHVKCIKRKCDAFYVGQNNMYGPMDPAHPRRMSLVQALW